MSSIYPKPSASDQRAVEHLMEDPDSTRGSVDRLRRTIIAIVVIAVVGFAGVLLYNEEAARSCTAKGEETTGSIIKKCEPPPSSLEEFLR